jgi:hypothetical protein
MSLWPRSGSCSSSSLCGRSLESDVGVGLEVGSALEEVLLLAGGILRSDLLAEKALHGNAFLVITSAKLDERRMHVLIHVARHVSETRPAPLLSTG